MSVEKMIPFIDLASQQALIRDQIDAAMTAVLDHGQYIMGPEVKQLETALGQFSGVKHAISCSSGTDALLLALMALGVKPGQGVIVPSFTFAASAEVMPCLGAMPIFAEIDPVTFNLDPDRLSDAMATAKDMGIDVVGIISVGLFGQPSDYNRIQSFADQHGLWLMDDAAQSYGASFNDQNGQARNVGHLGVITATSFFPAKPLGCYGDGGAVFTEDDNLAEAMISARIHGMGRVRYTHDRIGMTARLDSLQAAILIEKLKIFPDELIKRQHVANRYAEGLGDAVTTPKLAAGATSTWAQYVITLDQGVDRQMVQDRLKDNNVPTAIYYPMGMHQQKPYAHYPVAKGGLPITEDLCHRVLALPMHPYLEEDAQDHIIASVINAVT